MRSGPDNRPGNRFRSNQPSQQRPPQGSQAFNSQGPGERIRGNASQIYQRYLTLAQEAARNDDRIASENYYQHAEHYFRVHNESRERNSSRIGTVATVGSNINDAQLQMDDNQPDNPDSNRR
jgi:Domain of unknown function (DUF4167)